ncbi:MAG: hypothetical protein M1823_004101 [Watsoniomyces obsoletus]|nr:MAG: hypothetical protein M1823_004101 [Watsoniomyces obsoletus]
MHSSDEDEDVKQAIALSLGNEYQPISGSSSKVGETTAVPGKESVIVDLCDDTDASDNELTAVLPVKGTTHPVPISADTGDRNGKEEIEQSPVAGPDQAIHGLPEDAGPSLDSKDTGSTTKSLLQTLNRKQMEEERLARRKRKASVSPPGLRRKKLTQDSDIEVLSEKRRKAVNKEENEQIQEPVLQGVSTGTGPLLGLSPSSTSGIQYPQGVVRKTWAFGYAREEDIKIEEVLQKKDLSIAVLSAFQWDVEWLLHKLDLNKTKIIFVMQAKDEATKTRYRSEIAGMGNLRLCFPSMAGNVNCMHSKLQLLFHPTYLRVVVPSANLTSYDWGEAGGVMENMVFLVDLPRLKEPDQPVKKVKENLTFFGQELVYFLEAMGLEADVIKGVLQFDFSATKDLAFVHSIGGPHAGEAWRRTGYCGLGTAVQRLGLACQDPLDIDFVTSSVGSLKFDFLYAIYLAAQGDDGLKEYDIRTAPRPTARNKDAIAARDQLVQQEKRLLETVKQGFRIFFPTRDTVVESKGGPAVRYHCLPFPISDYAFR